MQLLLATVHDEYCSRQKNTVYVGYCGLHVEAARIDIRWVAPRLSRRWWKGGVTGCAGAMAAGTTGGPGPVEVIGTSGGVLEANLVSCAWVVDVSREADGDTHVRASMCGAYVVASVGRMAC
jgi:hypothetical protein